MNLIRTNPLARTLTTKDGTRHSVTLVPWSRPVAAPWNQKTHARVFRPFPHKTGGEHLIVKWGKLSRPTNGS